MRARSWPMRRSSVLSYAPSRSVASTSTMPGSIALDSVGARRRASASIAASSAPARVDVLPERAIGEAGREVADDEAEERLIARARAERAIDARRRWGRACRCACRSARASSSAARVGLDAAAHPFGGAGEAVEVDVADDGVDVAGARDELGRHHLGAGAVLGLRREDEARIAARSARDER